MPARPSFAATATHKVFGFWSHNKALKCLSIRKWAAVQSKINAALSPKCIHTRKAGGEGYAYILYTHLLASTLTTAPEGQTLLLHKRSLKPQLRTNGRGSSYCRYIFLNQSITGLWGRFTSYKGSSPLTYTQAGPYRTHTKRSQENRHTHALRRF